MHGIASRQWRRRVSRRTIPALLFPLAVLLIVAWLAWNKSPGRATPVRLEYHPTFEAAPKGKEPDAVKPGLRLETDDPEKEQPPSPSLPPGSEKEPSTANVRDQAGPNKWGWIHFPSIPYFSGEKEARPPSISLYLKKLFTPAEGAVSPAGAPTPEGKTTGPILTFPIDDPTAENNKVESGYLPEPIIPVRLLFEDGSAEKATGAVPGDIIPAGCPGCGTGGGVLRPPTSGLAAPGGCSSCGSGGCIPGRTPCACCEGKTAIGRFLCEVYECICCPDPCYDPRWQPIADAAFFVDAARPQTQIRLRWDAGRGLELPDRAEFFWARADGLGLGPAPPLPRLTEVRLAYNDLIMYTEAATGRIAMFVETSYRSIDPNGVAHSAGMGDMYLGTKTLIFDCELFQISTQMRTFLPVGRSRNGLGAGHVSLEPSLLFGLSLGPDCYLQTQVGEWIPFGDPTYSGPILNYHASINQVLFRPVANVPVIGTFEFNGWSFQDGAYTDPFQGPFQKASGYTYMSLGPGLRTVICDKLDFGMGTAFKINDHHWAAQLFRSELRLRF